jgi:hypothetical protein
LRDPSITVIERPFDHELERSFDQELERPFDQGLKDYSFRGPFDHELERPFDQPSRALSITFHYLAKPGSRGLKRGIFIDIEK